MRGGGKLGWRELAERRRGSWGGRWAEEEEAEGRGVCPRGATAAQHKRGRVQKTQPRGHCEDDEDGDAEERHRSRNYGGDGEASGFPWALFFGEELGLWNALEALSGHGVERQLIRGSPEEDGEGERAPADGQQGQRMTSCSGRIHIGG